MYTQDQQRIIHGTVAARYSPNVNSPDKDALMGLLNIHAYQFSETDYVKLLKKFTNWVET